VGRLVINNAMTVNGAFEAPSPDEWLVLDADNNNVSLEQFLVADTMVLGRKTYEGLAAAWPKLAGAGPAAAAAPRPPPLGPGAAGRAAGRLVRRNGRPARAARPPGAGAEVGERRFATGASGSWRATSTRCWPRPASRPPVATPWSRCCWRRWRRRSTSISARGEAAPPPRSPARWCGSPGRSWDRRSRARAPATNVSIPEPLPRSITRSPGRRSARSTK
jgi:hypothetical protein